MSEYTSAITALDRVLDRLRVGVPKLSDDARKTDPIPEYLSPPFTSYIRDINSHLDVYTDTIEHYDLEIKTFFGGKNELHFTGAHFDLTEFNIEILNEINFRTQAYAMAGQKVLKNLQEIPESRRRNARFVYPEDGQTYSYFSRWSDGIWALNRTGTKVSLFAPNLENESWPLANQKGLETLCCEAPEKMPYRQKSESVWVDTSAFNKIDPIELARRYGYQKELSKPIEEES